MANSETALTEARKALRHDTTLSASIKFEDTKLCDCVIKDVSETGMRLYVPRVAWLPVNFQICSQVFQRPVSVRKIWMCNESVGVQIVTKGME